MCEKGNRKLLDNFQYSPSRNFLHKNPFDVDPDMLKILGRADIYKSLKEWEDLYRRQKLMKDEAVLCTTR